MLGELYIVMQVEKDTGRQVMGDYYFPFGLSRRICGLVSFCYQEAIRFQNTVTNVVPYFVVKVSSLDCWHLA